jgi:1,4-alpha-glucan branching enzyme
MIKQARERRTGGHRLTFVLPPDEPAGAVSVVGNFNGWMPGVHELRRRRNGTRSVSIALPAGSSVHFRYLGEDGLWFDDPDADVVTEAGSVVQLG